MWPAIVHLSLLRPFNRKMARTARSNLGDAGHSAEEMTTRVVFEELERLSSFSTADFSCYPESHYTEMLKQINYFPAGETN